MPFRFEGVEFGVESRASPSAASSWYHQRPRRPVHGHRAAAARGAPGPERRRRAGRRWRRSSAAARSRSMPTCSREAFRQRLRPGRLEVVRTSPTIVVDAGAQPGRDPGQRRGHPGDVQLHQAGAGGRRPAGKGRARQSSPSCAPSTGDLVEDICLTQSTSPRAIPAERTGRAGGGGRLRGGGHVRDRKARRRPRLGRRPGRIHRGLRRGHPRHRLHHLGGRGPHAARKGGDTDGTTDQGPARMAPGHAQEAALDPRPCSPRRC